MKSGEDTRVVAKWDGPISVKFYGELYSIAKYALIDAGESPLATRMRMNIAKAKNQREGLKIIEQFVRFQ